MIGILVVLVAIAVLKLLLKMVKAMLNKRAEKREQKRFMKASERAAARFEEAAKADAALVKKAQQWAMEQQLIRAASLQHFSLTDAELVGESVSSSKEEAPSVRCIEEL